jgi:hypothetical protein
MNRLSLSFLRRLRAVLILGLLLPGAPAMATEEPKFASIVREGDFEVREYPALVVAEVSVGGDRDEAANAGFRLLAGYIFGGNTRRERLPMTAPVVQSRSAGESIPMTAPVIQVADKGMWTVQFVMPDTKTLATLPLPNDERVHLRLVPATRIAVVRFSGLARPDDVVKRTAALHEFIARRRLKTAGSAALARYNPPWTLWFMRRNEVMIPVHE